MCFGFLFNSERLQLNLERNERHSERIVLKLAFFAILESMARYDCIGPFFAHKCINLAKKLDFCWL